MKMFVLIIAYFWFKYFLFLPFNGWASFPKKKNKKNKEKRVVMGRQARRERKNIKEICHLIDYEWLTG